MIRVLLRLWPLLLAVPFIGVERIAREHHTDYVPFVKQRPSLDFVFRNGARCGECDTISLTLLRPDDLAAFEDYCAARFGLDVKPCHAIFREQDRVAFEAGR